MEKCWVRSTEEEVQPRKSPEMAEAKKNYVQQRMRGGEESTNRGIGSQLPTHPPPGI